MRILIVRLRQIGDVVFTTPAVAALRRQFPDAHLTYLVEPAAAPIVAGNPHLDEVIVTPRRGGIAGMLADVSARVAPEARALRSRDRFSRRPARLAADADERRAPRRIGYNVVARRWMYTDVVERPRELRRRHSVENQWDLLAALDMAAPTPAGNPVEMPVDRGREGERRRAPRRGRRGARRRSRGDSRQRQLAVPPVAAARRSSRRSPRSRRRPGGA